MMDEETRAFLQRLSSEQHNCQREMQRRFAEVENQLKNCVLTKEEVQRLRDSQERAQAWGIVWQQVKSAAIALTVVGAGLAALSQIAPELVAFLVGGDAE